MADKEWWKKAQEERREREEKEKREERDRQYRNRYKNSIFEQERKDGSRGFGFWD